MRLQVHDSLYSGGKVPPTCVMCGREAENREHFLLRCQATEEIHAFHLARVQELLAGDLQWDCVTADVLTQLLLDPTDLLSSEGSLDEPSRDRIGDSLERISRSMILQLSRRRLELLNLRPGPTTGTKGARNSTRARPQTRRKYTTFTHECQENGR